MENKEETDIEDEEIVLEDKEITPEEDPEKVTVIREDDPECKQTSEGDQIIGEGKSILKPNPKAKESGQRSWFDLS